MSDQNDYIEQVGVRAARLSIAAASSIAVLMAASTPLPAAAQAQPQAVVPGQTPKDLVDALHAAFGEHHARAVHAKGILLTGSFSPDPAARSLSRAAVFAGGTLPVTARFSDFTGIPDIPDVIPEANPRGFAFKIKAGDGDMFDVVTHSFNGFPVATSDEFAAFLRSVGASGPDAPHPTAIEQFLQTHPIAKAFVTSQKPPPASFATAAYFGVNSFKFTNASGAALHVRYRFVPLAGEQYLGADALKAKGANYLREELPGRLKAGAISFDWYAQVAATGDKIEDPSVAWPESRRLVRLGSLSLTAVAEDPALDRQTLFLPGQAHAGIESADPMLTLRNAAYPISFGARQ
jgi:catalase